jgi:hypothetical protein
MASSSVSFRISRNTEDLATTIHALSQRLVKLEQRLAALEGQVIQTPEVDPEELARLDHVERLLQDCRDLLEEEALPQSAGAEEAEEEEGEGGPGFLPAAPVRDGYPSAA